jgi:acyl carrier protein
MDTRTRLIKCFSGVFPHLQDQDIVNASPATVAGWDSIAYLNIVALIQEEFRIAVDWQEFQELASFQQMLGYLSDRNCGVPR